METRIRYKENQDNTLTSNKTFNIKGRVAQVGIDLNDFTFKVTDYMTGEVLSSGSGKTDPDVKKAAKAALASLGYEFENENRNRKPASETEKAPTAASAA